MMNKKEIFKKIGAIINELTDQYQFVSDNPESLNDLELELFLANANFLSDHIEILRKLTQKELSSPESVVTAQQPVSSGQEAPEKKPEIKEEAPSGEPVTAIKSDQPEIKEEDTLSEEVTPEVPLRQEEKKEENNSRPAAEQEEISDEPSIRFMLDVEAEEDQPVTDHEEKPEAAGQPSRPHKEEADNHTGQQPAFRQEPVTDARPVVNEVIIGERTISIDNVQEIKKTPDNSAPPTINERLSAQREQQTLGSNFNRQQVTDLKAIISLNDKLLFVKDLFNGYSLAYSEAIELVNRFDSLDAADNFLKSNYAVKNHWQEKQATVDKLYQALNRRFSK